MPETNDTKLYEKIIARREVFRGKLIRVEHWDAELASGRVSLREIVKNANAAAVGTPGSLSDTSSVSDWTLYDY